MIGIKSLPSRTAMKAAALVAAATGASGGLAFATQVVLARSLPVDSYGALAAALVAVNILAPLASFGTGLLLLRCFGIEGWRGQRWVRPCLTVTAATSAACVAVVLVWGAVLTDSDAVRSLVWFLLPLIPAQAAFDLVVARYQVEERVIALSGWLVSRQAALFVAASGIALSGGRFEPEAAFGVAGVGLLCAGLLALRPLTQESLHLAGHGERPRVRSGGVESPGLAAVVREAWPFALSGLFYFVYFQSDVILLAFIAGPREAGLYGVAASVLAAAYLVPGAVYQRLVLPKLHRWAEHDRERFRRTYRQGNRLLLVAGVCVCVAIVGSGGWVIPAVFGSQYVDASRLVVVLALAVPARYVATSIGAVLVTGEHMRRKVWLQGAGAALNLVASLMLIPSAGALGAAAATVLSECALACLYWLEVRRSVFGPSASPWARPLIVDSGSEARPTAVG
jgi:O-antigen/teichoic acid export membrane protein